MKKIQNTIDKIAYCSLFLDVCIAVITTLTILNIGNAKTFLIPLNQMLTLVVVLSIALFLNLIFLKHEQSILDKLLQRKYEYKPKTRSLIYKLGIRILPLLKKIKKINLKKLGFFRYIKIRLNI